MKNWISGLLIAVIAMGVGVGQIDASSKFNSYETPVVSVNVDNAPIVEFVQKVGRSSGSFSSGSRSSGGFGSSSRSSSGSSSRSSSGSFGSGWGSSSSKPKSSPAASSSSKPSTSTIKSSFSWGSSSSSKSSVVKPANKTASSVDSKITSSTKSSGKSFSSKESAISSFKADNAKETVKGGKFTSRYDSPPSVRPSHIPATTTVANKNVNVTYNSQYGGYGYMHPTLGTWMMYDMLSDAAMISAMSHNHGYYSGGGYNNGGYVAYSPGFSSFACVLFIIVVIGVMILAGVSNRGKA